LRSFLCL